jgi:hypothetical protein
MRWYFMNVWFCMGVEPGLSGKERSQSWRRLRAGADEEMWTKEERGVWSEEVVWWWALKFVPFTGFYWNGEIREYEADGYVAGMR